MFLYTSQESQKVPGVPLGILRKKEVNKMKRKTFVQGIQSLKLHFHLICNRNVLGIGILESVLRKYRPKLS